jgi:hypothetical protein
MKPPGNFPAADGPLAIVAGQREEIDAWPARTAGGRVDRHGFAILGDHRRACLLGEKASFKRQNAIANLLFDAAEGKPQVVPVREAVAKLPAAFSANPAPTWPPSANCQPTCGCRASR